MGIGPNYIVWLKDQSGVRQAVFTDTSGPPYGIPQSQFRSLYFTHQVNKPGTLRLEIDGRSDAVALFEPDVQIEVYRRYPPAGLGFYLEWEGFFHTPERNLYENGQKVFTANCAGYLDLMQRAIIAYYAGTAYTDKAGPGETVIKEFVNENIGPGAGDANRYRDGIRPGLSIQADAGNGSNWEGQRSNKSLHKVCEEIALATGVDFDIVGTGPMTFEFRVYDGQRGADRTNVGLNPATGRNAAGNVPVIFAESRDNVRNMRYIESRGASINVAVALGTGTGTGRSVRVRENAAELALSPWAAREASRNASQEDTDDALDAVGDAILEESQPQITLDFEALQQRNLAYGKDYTWGDLVTAQMDEIEMHKKIVSVGMSVSERQGERIDINLADVVGY